MDAGDARVKSRYTPSAQRRIKSAFDPDWLLNPSKVFPLEVEQAPGRVAA